MHAPLVTPEGDGLVLRVSSTAFCACRGVVPAKLQAGHYAAVYGNEMWVFPGPRNHNMRRVFCLDMQRYRCGGPLLLCLSPHHLFVCCPVFICLDMQRCGRVALLFSGAPTLPLQGCPRSSDVPTSLPAGLYLQAVVTEADTQL